MSEKQCEACDGTVSGMQKCPACAPHMKTLLPQASPTDAPTLPPQQPGGVVDSAKARPTNAPSISDEFGDYEMISEIARGGMGVVYKARHCKLNRVVALKMVLSGRFSSEEDVRRFYMEAESAAQLDHPGIVPVFDIGEHEGQPYFAMKYIEGGSLADHIGSFRNDIRRGMALLANVADAVHHAHQRGILHRDLKPANVLMDEQQQPLVTDLGLAKSTAEDSNLTKTGAILGTPGYMPPEQAGGEQSVTTAADIYALGAIMYEMLTGQPPYVGPSAMDVVMQVLSDEIRPPRKIQADVNSELELICLKCLARNPEDRYASAAEFGNDLNRWLNGESISVSSPSVSSQIGRWMKANPRTTYCLFATLLLLGFASPILALFTLREGLGAVYQHFPDATRPWYYAFYNLPLWVAPNILKVFAFILLPTIGLWNTLIVRPSSFKDALRAGLFTSGVSGIIIAAVVGWLLLALVVADYSKGRILTLGRALWPPDNVSAEDARTAALNIYRGLEDVPENTRADVLADRIVAENVRLAPAVFPMLFGIGILVSTPIMYGTLISWLLFRRGMPFHHLAIRYVAGSLALGAGLFSLLFSTGGNLHFDKTSIRAEDFPVYLFPGLGLLFLLLAWLILKRWNKPKTENSVETEATLV